MGKVKKRCKARNKNDAAYYFKFVWEWRKGTLFDKCIK